MFRNKTRIGEYARAAIIVLAGSLFIPGWVRAQITTQQPASLLFFPLVVADGAQDTLIQITNASNNFVAARCFYGAVTSGTVVVTDFAIQLTRQQPTQWIASRGRRADVFPNRLATQRCTQLDPDCPEAGIDPGLEFTPNGGAQSPVPAVAAGFRGSLVCVQVDASGNPIAFNSLSGQATIVGAGSATIAYSAAGSLGNEDSVGATGNTLSLGNPGGLPGQYEGCPQTYVLNHLAEGAEDALLGSGSSVSARITALSCSLDFATGQAASTMLNLSVTNALEQTFSADVIVDGYLDTSLLDIDDRFSVGTLGSDAVRTQITASPGGVVIIGSESRVADGASGTSAIELHRDLEERDDEIVLPDL